MQAFTMAMGTATPETATMAQATSAAAQDASRANASGLAATSKAGPSAEGQSPIPLPWVIGLGLLMIVCGAAAWMVRRNNEQRIRSQWNHK